MMGPVFVSNPLEDVPPDRSVPDPVQTNLLTFPFFDPQSREPCYKYAAVVIRPEMKGRDRKDIS